MSTPTNELLLCFLAPSRLPGWWEDLLRGTHYQRPGAGARGSARECAGGEKQVKLRQLDEEKIGFGVD